jgi:hypothetical protein
MEVLLIGFSFVTVVIAMSCYCKSNQCAENINLDKNSPIGLYWLLAVVSSALALFTAITALGVYDGTLAWLSIHTVILVPILLFSPFNLSQDDTQ